MKRCRFSLEIRGRSEPSSGDERVWVGIFNCGPGGESEAARPVFEAIAVFGASLPEPQPAAPWSLAQPQDSRFTAESLYGESWLFHGPPFHALVGVGRYSEEGIDGTLRVLPWEPLFRPGQRAALHTDLIVIDSFTHLLGCWGLDYLRQGDVVFPLRLEALEIYGDRPPVGTDVACRIAVQEVQRHRVRVLVEIIRPDGTVWIRIRDWEDWRFHWPGRYRDVFRQPQDIFVGEEIALVRPGARSGWPGQMRLARAPRRHGPAGVARRAGSDSARPGRTDCLSCVVRSGPAAVASALGANRRQRGRPAPLAGRRAAGDLPGRSGDYRGPGEAALPRSRSRSRRPLSACHLDCSRRWGCPGAGRERAVRTRGNRRGTNHRSSAWLRGLGVHPGRVRLLGRGTGASRAEWVARFWCAKEAAAKASGVGLAAGPTSAEVVWLAEESGEMHVRLSTELLTACSEPIESPLRIVSARRANYAWAWTLGEGVEL